MTDIDPYHVWRRSDGLISASCGAPRDEADWSFEILLKTTDVFAAATRIRAERIAILMNEDIFPIAESAAFNRVIG